MRVLALDLATTTGVTIGASGEAPRAWSVDLGRGKTEDARFSNVLRLTQGLIREHKPDLIVGEAAIGGPKSSAYLIGLVACVRGAAFNFDVRYEPAYLSTVRKHFLGKSLTTKHFPHLKPAAAKKAIKAEVIKRCELLGWRPETDDEADAMAIWDWAQATFASGYQSKPLGELFGVHHE